MKERYCRELLIALIGLLLSFPTFDSFFAFANKVEDVQTFVENKRDDFVIRELSHKNERLIGKKRDIDLELFGCPRSVECNFTSRYRTNDGSCNNVMNPLWGASERPFQRYLPPVYEDGFMVPRGEGRMPSLPTPRQVSVTVSSVDERPNKSPISLMVMQFGQFIDHDLTLSLDFEEEICCDDFQTLTFTSPECKWLDVRGDNFYSQYGVQCLKFVRSLYVSPACNPGPREQVNVLTAYIDGSQVYGSTTEVQHSLRSFSGGQLKVGPGQEELTGQCSSTCSFTFLPVHNNTKGEIEFAAGDIRVEDQPGLTSMHTLFLRAHNDICLKLADQHPDWDDERLFQEGRRIIGAIIQQITYVEFLPLLLGSKYIRDNNLSPLPINSPVYETRYRNDLNPTTPNVISAAAFRFGHSLIRSVFKLFKVDIKLEESFFNHSVTITPGSYPSDFLKGIASLHAERMDHFMVRSLTNKLFAEGPDFNYGTDLLSRNIMRAREHGVPSYNHWRGFCGLETFTSFKRLKRAMPKDVASAFESIYRSVDDIDLFPAAIAESSKDSDGVLGPTLRCLIGKFLTTLKFGDRYWYEGNAQPEPFSLAQLSSIHQTTLASLICEYTETSEIQQLVFLVEHPGHNRKIDCSQIGANSVPKQVQNLW